jgi:hypothetical protein
VNNASTEQLQEKRFGNGQEMKQPRPIDDGN